MADPAPTRELAEFASRLIGPPESVRDRAHLLILDWLGCAVGGNRDRVARIALQLAREMGPEQGRSEWVGGQGGSSPMWAAFLNAVAGHVLEQDDLHPSSVAHLGTVVIPAALAAAQGIGASGEDLVCGVVAGYEVGARVGEFLGPSHYEIFHTTGTAGALAAAAAVGRVLRLGPQPMAYALGNAGTEAAGLWQFMQDGADSKAMHAGNAAWQGVAAAFLARAGLRGSPRILEGSQGLGAALSRNPNSDALHDGLGRRWATTEVALKVHACCRHTHPSIDALLKAQREHGLSAGDIESVEAHVHRAALDVLEPVVDPKDPHEARFCMPFVLSLAALHGAADIDGFQQLLHDPEVRGWMPRVSMTLDPEIDAAYPRQWRGRVVIQLRSGDRILSEVADPLGDPARPLGLAEVEAKMMRLVAFGGGEAAHVGAVSAAVRGLGPSAPPSALLGRLLDRAEAPATG